MTTRAERITAVPAPDFADGEVFAVGDTILKLIETHAPSLFREHGKALAPALVLVLGALIDNSDDPEARAAVHEWVDKSFDFGVALKAARKDPQ